MVTGNGRLPLQKADEQWGGPPAVPTTTWSAAGLILAHVAFGVRYIPLALVSSIAVLEGVIFGGRVVLQPELGKNRIRSNFTI